MAAPIANQRSQSVMHQLLDQLDEPHREMLREFDAGEDRDLDDPVLQTDLVDATGASNFTMHFGDLGEMGLVSEIGKFAQQDGKTVISQPRYRLTDRGRHLVSSHGPEFDPKQLQGEVDVEPEVRESPEPIGREPDQLTDLSDSVDAFERNTDQVILHEGVEHRSADPKGTVEVTITYDGETTTINFPAVKWHNSGLDLLFEEVRNAFGFPPDLDQREWGLLQQRWIDMAEVVDHDEVDGDNEDRGESNADDYTL